LRYRVQDGITIDVFGGVRFRQVVLG
jgi:hypothetical protein